MTEWWHALRPDQQVFYAIALLSTSVLVVQLLLGLLGVDHGMADVDVSSGHGGGLGLFSVQAIATFFVGFGWVGVIWLNRGHAIFWAVVAGVIAGGGLMAGVVALMRRVLRLQETGTLVYANAVGSVGTVYVPVPARRGNGGQVEVVIQGRTVFADAVNESSEILKSGTRVRIASILGQTTLVVEPL